MTNREYLSKLFSELFDETKPTEELIKDKTYCDFEDDIQEIIKEDFTRIGCDTSTGEPTWIGMELWMRSPVSERLMEKFEQKYKNNIQ